MQIVIRKNKYIILRACNKRNRLSAENLPPAMKEVYNPLWVLKNILRPVLPLIATIMFFSGCGKREELVTGSFIVMGTQASVTIRRDGPLRPAQAVKSVSKVMRAMEKDWSLFDPESEIAKINRDAGLRATPVSPDTVAILSVATKFSKKTDGMFDITLGPLMKAWGFRGSAKPDTAPSPEQISEALNKIGYARIHLSGESVFLEKPGMAIDLGGIAKGVAVDKACKALVEKGVTNALINLGGNIRCIGRPGKDSPWLIGVRNPFNRSEIIGTIRLTNGLAVATSGNYERFVVIDGERYSHVIDPRTGRPVSGTAGVTVVCKSATDADIMSTALFVAGTREYKQSAASKTVEGALFIPDKNPLEIWTDSGMKAIFTPQRQFKNKVFLIEE